MSLKKNQVSGMVAWVENHLLPEVFPWSQAVLVLGVVIQGEQATVSLPRLTQASSCH